MFFHGLFALYWWGCEWGEFGGRFVWVGIVVGKLFKGRLDCITDKLICSFRFKPYLGNWNTSHNRPHPRDDSRKNTTKRFFKTQSNQIHEQKWYAQRKHIIAVICCYVIVYRDRRRSVQRRSKILVVRSWTSTRTSNYTTLGMSQEVGSGFLCA